jgi:peptidoglycan/LPS O-acetylase OafA/YrhL
VLLVVLNHAGVSFLGGGYIGVDVFFVLSGFLITGLLLRDSERGGRVGFINFYSRRARRILPSAALTLVATDIAAYYLLNVVRAKETIVDSISAAFFAVNIHYAHQGTNYFAQGQPPSPIRQFWSLAVEEQFYVVWPALMALVLFGIVIHRRRRHKRLAADGITAPPFGRPVTQRAIRRLLVVLAIIGVASFVWSIHETNTVPNSAFFSTLTRVWELALGAGLAIAGRALARLPGTARGIMGWIGLAAIFAAAVEFTGGTAFPGYAALLPTVGAALVIAGGIAATDARWGPGRLLSLPPMQYVGDRSYTYYLWHWPVLVIVAQHAGHPLSLRTNLLLALGAFALSIITYKFFENPIRHARWNPPARALLLAPAAVLLVVCIAGQARWSIDVGTTRAALRATPVTPFAAVQPGPIQFGSSTITAAELPAVKASADASRSGAPIPSNLSPPIAQALNDHAIFPLSCQPTLTGSTAPICHLGDTSSQKTFVVMGDSHAEMYEPAILAMAARGHWNVVPLIKSGCTPPSWLGKTGTSSCHAWYRWALKQARALHPDVFLITGAFSGEVTAQLASTTESLDEAVTTLRHSVRHLVIMGDDPRQSSQPVDCLLAPGADMKKCSTTWGGSQVDALGQIGDLAETDGVPFIDPTNWYCGNDRCPMVIGHTVVYVDTGHVSKTYATQLAAPFRVTLRKAIHAKLHS